jgi:ribosomal protein S18 acetylase RimI-like enzyme
MRYDVVEELEETGAVEEAVRRGIRGSDPPDVGARNWERVCLSLRDETGSIAGGVYGATMWGWLMVDGLWVFDGLRRRGLGSRLLANCEALAQRRGCRGAWLGTFDFQAKGWYERRGYRVIGELPGFPEGHTHYHLRKAFAGRS